MTAVLSTCVALQLNKHPDLQPSAALLSDQKVNHTKVNAGTDMETTVQMHMVMGCGRKKMPGAGMDPDEGFITIYKDGYFHVRCMMDEMFKIANYHDELTRVHEYKVKTNVSIVKYADRVDVEKQVKMTPRICFDFCRTIPDMNQFGLVYGRECYCTPYYHQIPGDGVCSSPCEGDNAVTCGNQDGMADVYEMHTCGDTVSDAQEDVDDMKKMLEHAHELATNATLVLNGLDDSVTDLNVEEIRHPIMNATRELAALIRPLKEAIAKGETNSEHLDDFLATVEDGTTSAHKVLRIENMQDKVNEAANELKTTGDLVDEFLVSMSSAAAFKAAGITKTSAQELGKALAGLSMIYDIDPMSDDEKSVVMSDLGCTDDLFDCENNLRYYWSGSPVTMCKEVGNGWGSLRISEYGDLGDLDFNAIQKETVVDCAEVCKESELCHFFTTYNSQTVRRDDFDDYKYQYCAFYTFTDPSNCQQNTHILERFVPRVVGPETYYYSYEWYYYYYYYNEETGGSTVVQYYYSVFYDYTSQSTGHFAIKKDYAACVGPVTVTNIEGITVGL